MVSPPACGRLMTSRPARRRRRTRREQEREDRFLTKHHGCLDFPRNMAPLELSSASLDCFKNVKWKRRAQAFMLRRVSNCIILSDELMSCRYKTRRLRKRLINDHGKPRLISPVDFRDRVVQRALCDSFLIPVMLDGILYDNSASQKGKGPDFARNRFAQQYARAAERYGRGAWCVSADFENYFGSIDNRVAMRMVEDAAMRLVTCGSDYDNYKLLMRTISLFLFQEKGLGLGNQASQTMAIAYASPIDHAIREVCRCGLSSRYMDDTKVFCRTKSEAFAILGVIEEYAHRLGLKLNRRKTKVAPITHPQVFLKTKFTLEEDNSIRRDVSRETIRHYRHHFKSMAGLVAKGAIPATVLDESEASWKGVANRATDPDAYVEEMHEFCQRVRRYILGASLLIPAEPQRALEAPVQMNLFDEDDI